MFSLNLKQVVPNIDSTPIGQDSLRYGESEILLEAPPSPYFSTVWVVDSPRIVHDSFVTVRIRLTAAPIDANDILLFSVWQTNVNAFTLGGAIGFNFLAPDYIKIVNLAPLGAGFDGFVAISVPLGANYTTTAVRGAVGVISYNLAAPGPATVPIYLSCSNNQSYPHHVGNTDGANWIHEFTPNQTPFIAWGEGLNHSRKKTTRIALNNNGIFSQSFIFSGASDLPYARMQKRITNKETKIIQAEKGVWPAGTGIVNSVMAGSSNLYTFNETVVGTSSVVGKRQGLTIKHEWVDNNYVAGVDLDSLSYNGGYFFEKNNDGIILQNLNDVYKNRVTRVANTSIRQIITPFQLPNMTAVANISGGRVFVSDADTIYLITFRGDIIGGISLAADLGTETIEDLDFKDNLLYVLSKAAVGSDYGERNLRIYRVTA